MMNNNKTIMQCVSSAINSEIIKKDKKKKQKFKRIWKDFTVKR